ncbi:helix-turn-helix transcriptional regulator [Flavobacterium sp. xlx-214]|uniref:helix-turn-helix domain-containing protein n=1 Tax=unclassified Flavobacterium TaxID=196869 RepID=UPI0013D570CC|nr:MULTISPECIES: helix-turn-helix transcriptional regulator [unclassified Flavobacterium]MBA5791741.1 helix-turn-helix transcriptional regulator [Flavobacterium sp. xlx-221]QMI82980.1 helix-turn-helix transcriptional regulator [Flavobacterium sp. xlx-214]
MNHKEYRANFSKKVCEYITERFLSNFSRHDNIKSQNDYAKAVGLTSSTIGKIPKEKNYSIPLSTLASILKFENIEMDKFFGDFKKYCENERN